MRVFILFDLEGVTGYGCTNISGSTKEFAYSDVNAAIRGAKKGGATDIIVGDWHAYGGNLNPKKLVQPVRLEQYADRFEIQNQQIDRCFFLGCHAMAGTPNTVDPHTEEYYIQNAFVDNQKIGEVGLIAYYFSAMKIPVVLFEGSAEAMMEVREIMPDAVCVAVKRGFESLSPEESAKQIEDSAMLAIQTKPKLVYPKKQELGVEFTDGTQKTYREKNFQRIYDQFTIDLTET